MSAPIGPDTLPGTPVVTTHKVTTVTATQLTQRATVLQRVSMSSPASATDGIYPRQCNVGDWVIDFADGRRLVYTDAEKTTDFN